MKRKIYEHLLAQDPIGAFEKIKEDIFVILDMLIELIKKI